MNIVKIRSWFPRNELAISRVTDVKSEAVLTPASNESSNWLEKLGGTSLQELVSFEYWRPSVQQSWSEKPRQSYSHVGSQREQVLDDLQPPVQLRSQG
jgi:hypothetical protein